MIQTPVACHSDADGAEDAPAPDPPILYGVPDGAEALLLAAIMAGQFMASPPGPDALLCIVRDDLRMARLARMLRFLRPQAAIVELPAWDCLPYDRASPHTDVAARRLRALAELVGGDGRKLVLTTLAGALQRLPARHGWDARPLTARPGETIPRDRLLGFLLRGGYRRAETVRERGEFALRGGIVDIFAPTGEAPVRLDFFGDDLDAIRHFDAASQRTNHTADAVTLHPVSEILLDPDSIARFRQGYRECFGGTTEGDLLYEEVSAGRRPEGVEHWLPLFHPEMETLFDYLPGAPVLLDHQIGEVLMTRLEAIADHYTARKDDLDATRHHARDPDGPAVYKPLPPGALYLDRGEWQARLATCNAREISPYAPPESGGEELDFGARPVPDFAAARTDPARNLYAEIAARVRDEQAKPTLIAISGEASQARLTGLLSAAGLPEPPLLSHWPAPGERQPGHAAFATLALERGFTTADICIYTEQDLLGPRPVRPVRKPRRGAELITELSALEIGDKVVHIDHGVGRYDGLEIIDAGGAPHDCLRLIYAGDAKLYLPVENLDLLSRLGGAGADVTLDRLGGAAWQARKAALKSRIREIAQKLLAVAAQRELRRGTVLEPPEGAYAEFCARFSFVETGDQARAIDDVRADLAGGRAMDRLICGDVGFGKTEVALRAAFITTMAGLQVAVLTPTTLLARQHFALFQERFAHLPVRVAQLSRLTAPKDAKAVKQGLKDGQMDIVIGTHALLAKDIDFARLGLAVVDEEQHFGVAHKERLKTLRAAVHVLTLSATPIPRTLQMALAGVREMSLIATPPVDRLAVRTFVLESDRMVLREAIRREIGRGGQIFYVCPRIADLERAREFVRELAPEASLAVAHGRMPPRELEAVMGGFVDGKFNVLLSTNIIESGLDIPNANTMIVHRADRFGLSQLYQLRGRIGRGKVRGYCYLTLPAGWQLQERARKRLHVMQTLDSLGAGFSLASHDMDIRGAGNLLGDEQSGHIREVGIELYQKMLEEAVIAARGDAAGEGGTGEGERDENWSPVINLGSAVRIPDDYVGDLSLRLGLYRRLALLGTAAALDDFAAELVDRFGALPEAAQNLLRIVRIKLDCKRAGIAKLDGGPKGAVVGFRKNRFANPAGLIGFLQCRADGTKLRPDGTLVVMQRWDNPAARFDGIAQLAAQLADIAARATDAGGHM